MTDQDRILNLLSQGKISKEEAGELLEALDETEGYSLAKPEMAVIDIDPIPPLPAVPERPELPTPPALVNVQKEIRETEKALSRLEQQRLKELNDLGPLQSSDKRESVAKADTSLKMVQLTSTSGDISIIVDPDLKEPQFDSEGKVKIKRLDDDNWIVTNHDDDLSVILPKNYGVVLVADSGDVVIDGVPYVQGKVSSGDLSAENISKLDWVADSGDIKLENIEMFQGKINSGSVSTEHVKTVDVVIDSGDIHIENAQQIRAILTSSDLSIEKAGLVDVIVDNGDISINNAVMLRGKLTSGDVNFDHLSGLDFVVDSGDVSGSLLLTKGTHQLNVTSGDVSLEILEGSNLNLSGYITSGEASLNLPEIKKREDGYFEAKLGEGAASLNLNVDSGDVSIDVGKKRPRIKVDIDFDFDKLGFEGFGKGFFNFGAKGVETPTGLKWVHVDSWSGDVHISSDANISEPKTNRGSLQKNEQGNWKILSLTDDLQLVVPSGCGVVLSVKAGDVQVSHLPFIKGKVFAGDFTAKHIGGIDLFAAAGDIEASLLISEGHHHLMAAAGNLSLKFLKGSNVSYEGSNGFSVLSKLGLTKAHNGVVGDGKAKMTLRALAGEVDIKVEQ